MKILILGGGADQVALILELQRRGHETILIDYLSNPPARQYVTKHFIESTLDLSAVEKIAIEESVDLICTACTDQALLTMASVSEKLGLPTYISYKTARDVTNKLFMKNKMVECGIPTSRFAVLQSTNDIKKHEWINFPMVVKPADCNSSKGVRKVSDMNELVARVEEALKFSRTHTAIIEEFKQGTEISADLYIQGGQAIFLSATSSFKVADNDRFTILGSRYPVVDVGGEQKILSIAQDIAEAFDLKDCPLLIQLISDGENLSVIEFSARMGGGSKYRLIEILSGVDIMSKYVDLILGKVPDILPSKQVESAIMQYVYCLPGEISGFVNFDKMKSTGVITDYFFYKLPGATIDKLETSGDRAAGILVTAINNEELSYKIKTANESIKVLDSKNSDIMRHDLIR